MFSSGPCENLYSHFSDFTEKEFEVKELMITFVIIVLTAFLCYGNFLLLYCRNLLKGKSAQMTYCKYCAFYFIRALNIAI
jgi:hypothetical protein